jgi:hypothetical protein
MKALLVGITLLVGAAAHADHYYFESSELCDSGREVRASGTYIECAELVEAFECYTKRKWVGPNTGIEECEKIDDK